MRLGNRNFELAKQRSGFGPLWTCDERFSLAYTTHTYTHTLSLFRVQKLCHQMHRLQY